MKRAYIFFLQTVIILIGISALALLIWEPQIEGVNANATNFEIYLQDPFLAIVYAGAIPFFIALYQAVRVLGYMRKNKIFSSEAVRSLRIIKYCALAIICFIVIEEAFIISNASDDRAGGIFMGLLVTFGSSVIATAAAVFQKLLQKAVDIKSENDLTV